MKIKLKNLHNIKSYYYHSIISHNKILVCESKMYYHPHHLPNPHVNEKKDNMRLF